MKGWKEGREGEGRVMDGMDSKGRDWKRVSGSEGQEERDGKQGKGREGKEVWEGEGKEG